MKVQRLFLTLLTLVTLIFLLFLPRIRNRYLLSIGNQYSVLKYSIQYSYSLSSFLFGFGKLIVLDNVSLQPIPISYTEKNDESGV